MVDRDDGPSDVIGEEMPGDLRVTGSVTIPAGELAWRFSRAGGPGGQGVNTTDSRVELRFDLAATSAIPRPLKARALQRLESRLVDGVIAITASEHRSQLANRRAALTRLGATLAQAIAPPASRRRPTRPSARAVQSRLDTKKRHGRLKKQRRNVGD